MACTHFSKKVQSFLGFVQYFHKFVHNLSTIAKPLHKLTCKDELFAWTEECQAIFSELKHCVVSEPMLEIYNGSANTQVEVHTNASTKVLGAILLQKHAVAKHFHPIAYYSKK